MDTADRFFAPDGQLTTIPSKQAKRRLVLDRLVQDFEPGVRYTEQQVSDMLLRYHDDYAALRRYLVEEGFLTREVNVYWRTGGTFLV